jgi:hypothetical protein
MPALMVSKNKECRIYFIEIRDHSHKLIRRFKPFQKCLLKTGEYWDSVQKSWLPCLALTKDIVSQLGVGKGYRLALVISKYDGRCFLPLELKAIGYNVQSIVECLSKIETKLLSLVLDYPVFNEATSYLWDAYSRIEENDMEGARTALRKALLEVLRDEFVPKIKTLEEPEKFTENLRRLLSTLGEFVQYGGPHRGHAPRTTTEMILSMTTELLTYLAKGIENNVITLEGLNGNAS